VVEEINPEVSAKCTGMFNTLVKYFLRDFDGRFSSAKDSLARNSQFRKDVVIEVSNVINRFVDSIVKVVFRYNRFIIKENCAADQTFGKKYLQFFLFVPGVEVGYAHRGN